MFLKKLNKCLRHVDDTKEFHIKRDYSNEYLLSNYLNYSSKPDHIFFHELNVKDISLESLYKKYYVLTTVLFISATRLVVFTQLMYVL